MDVIVETVIQTQVIVDDNGGVVALPVEAVSLIAEDSGGAAAAAASAAAAAASAAGADASAAAAAASSATANADLSLAQTLFNRIYLGAF